MYSRKSHQHPKCGPPSCWSSERLTHPTFETCRRRLVSRCWDPDDDCSTEILITFYSHLSPCESGAGRCGVGVGTVAGLTAVTKVRQQSRISPAALFPRLLEHMHAHERRQNKATTTTTMLTLWQRVTPHTQQQDDWCGCYWCLVV